MSRFSGVGIVAGVAIVFGVSLALLSSSAFAAGIPTIDWDLMATVTGGMLLAFFIRFIVRIIVAANFPLKRILQKSLIAPLVFASVASFGWAVLGSFKWILQLDSKNDWLIVVWFTVWVLLFSLVVNVLKAWASKPCENVVTG